MILEEVREELFRLQDRKYRDFQSKLIPNVDPETIIGVRVFCKPFLEKVAGIFGECCISILEKVASPWSGRCHPIAADILC